MDVLGHEDERHEFKPQFDIRGIETAGQLFPPVVIGKQLPSPVTRERELVEVTRFVAVTNCLSVCHYKPDTETQTQSLYMISDGHWRSQWHTID